ncbi:hypothetical protein BJ508DRAFT_380103, partial [Ascobolus immersus RN42]
MIWTRNSRTCAFRNISLQHDHHTILHHSIFIISRGPDARSAFLFPFPSSIIYMSSPSESPLSSAPNQASQPNEPNEPNESTSVFQKSREVPNANRPWLRPHTEDPKTPTHWPEEDRKALVEIVGFRIRNRELHKFVHSQLDVETYCSDFRIKSNIYNTKNCLTKDSSYRRLEDISDRSFPEPFRHIAERYLLFYFRTLLPYFDSMFTPEEAAKMYMTNGKPRDELEFRLNHLIGTPGIDVFDIFVASYHDDSGLESEGSRDKLDLRRRHANGMIRDEYFELMKLVVESFLVELQKLVECQQGYYAIYCAFLSTGSLLGNFFVSDRFRSARLENTLLRYLKEEEISWDVVKGVEAATVDFRSECRGLLKLMASPSEPQFVDPYFEDDWPPVQELNRRPQVRVQGMRSKTRTIQKKKRDSA